MARIRVLRAAKTLQIDRRGALLRCGIKRWRRGAKRLRALKHLESSILRLCRRQENYLIVAHFHCWHEHVLLLRAKSYHRHYSLARGFDGIQHAYTSRLRKTVARLMYEKNRSKNLLIYFRNWQIWTLSEQTQHAILQRRQAE